MTKYLIDYAMRLEGEKAESVGLHFWLKMGSRKIDCHRVVSGRCYSESESYPNQVVVLSHTGAGNREEGGEGNKKIEPVRWQKYRTKRKNRR